MESHFPIRFAARISVSKAAHLLGIHRNTLVRSWHKQKGLVRLQKTATGRWFIESKEMERLLETEKLLATNTHYQKPVPGVRLRKR